MHPPGWYPDPQVPGQVRWWDGQQWTAHSRPAAGSAPAPSAGVFGPAGGAGAATGAGGAGPWAVPTAGAASGGRSRTGWIITAVVVAVAVIGAVGILAVTLLGTSTSTATAPRSSPVSSGPRTTGGTVAGGPTELDRRAAEAGVAVLGAEGAATHTHTLVVITVDGRPVQVPAYIGIDLDHNRIAVVHTHDTTGLVHVESPEAGDAYTLGQFLIMAGMPDDDAMCQQVTGGACTVHIDVGTPTDDERDLLGRYGGVHRGAPIASQGRDTELAPGAVIRIELTTTT